LLPRTGGPSGECLRGEGLVWLIGAVVCVVAAELRSRTATSYDCTARLVAASPRKYGAVEETDLYFYLLHEQDLSTKKFTEAGVTVDRVHPTAGLNAGWLFVVGHNVDGG